MRHKRIQLEDPVINLTPLIDVVFVILIMFIVVTPLLEVDQISLADAPKKSVVHSVTENAEFAIQVHKDNTIFLNKKLVSPEELEVFCRSAFAQNPRTTPQVFHDREAAFGTYQTVKNAIESAGFSQLDIVLKPQ